MNILRRIVSGKKNRYEKGGFDLDLTYITPRIMAMSLPGEGVHKIYRNSIDSVSQFLNERHPGTYCVFNLSGLKYDYKKFGGLVKDFPWEDHYPPPIQLLFQACQEIHHWLLSNIKNVIAVNCRAGKGRTGTLICCYLLFSGRFNKVNDALNFYKIKRFSQGGGVTQPSQIRYVSYFFSILLGKKQSPNILQLRSISIKTAPHMSNQSCRPVIEIRQDKKLVFSNKKISRESQSIISDQWEEARTHQIALANSEVLLCGDINCFLYHWGRLKLKKICRFSFNTAFLRPGMCFELSKLELDPDNFRKNKKVADCFKVFLDFEEGKCGCDSCAGVDERCDECRGGLGQFEESEKWSEIVRIVERRILANPSELLFGEARDTVDEELEVNIQGSCSSSEGSDD